MQALMIIEADTCPNGHGPLAEVTSLEASERTYHFEQSRCHVCTAVGEHMDAYRDNSQPQALMFHLLQD